MQPVTGSWTEYVNELYDDDDDDRSKLNTQDLCEGSQILKAKVENDNIKAPGPENIATEDVKAFAELSIEVITILLNIYRNYCVISITVNIYVMIT